MAKREPRVINREISWLSFNERVLQEAADATVPLLERIRFLGIFSSNLDEFFRVRFATIKRIVKYKVNTDLVLGGTPKQVLNQIKQIALQQRTQFAKTYEQILLDLEKEKVFILNEKQLSAAQGKFVKEYFRETVQPSLTPLLIDNLQEFPTLNDHHIYLAVKCSDKKSKKDNQKRRYALIDVPTNTCPRFLVFGERTDLLHPGRIQRATRIEHLKLGEAAGLVSGDE